MFINSTKKSTNSSKRNQVLHTAKCENAMNISVPDVSRKQPKVALNHSSAKRQNVSFASSQTPIKHALSKLTEIV